MKPWIIAGLSVALACMPAAAQAEVKAVASFSVLADMVAQVGQDHVSVTSLVGPNGDAHVFEPKPADAIIVNGATIVFVNGLGFEGWMDRLIAASGYHGTIVNAAEGVVARQMNEDGATATDPHAWQDLGNAQVYVTNIVSGLCQVDAANCAQYQANAERYAGEIRTLDAEVRAELAAVPEAQRKVITTHDALGYFGAAYGVTFLPAQGLSTDSEPSAAAVAQLIDQIRQEGVTALFLENMSNNRLLQQIASETGVKPAGELYPDALSTPDGEAPTYLEMMRHNAAVITAALSQQ